MVSMVEELEPPVLSIILAPFRFVKRFFRGLLARLPITDYKLKQYDKNKEEVESGISDVIITSKEVERTIKELEEEGKD